MGGGGVGVEERGRGSLNMTESLKKEEWVCKMYGNSSKKKKKKKCKMVPRCEGGRGWWRIQNEGEN